MDLTQEGSNVVATGKGTIDLTDLRFAESPSLTPFIESDRAVVLTGGSDATDVYMGATGPGNFGDLGLFLISSGSGDFVGIAGASREVAVPAGYTSGDPLSSSGIWLSQSFASMGINKGTYVWTWGTGTDADSFTLNIGTTGVVPEPSSWAMMLLGFVGLGFARYRRRWAWARPSVGSPATSR